MRLRVMSCLFVAAAIGAVPCSEALAQLTIGGSIITDCTDPLFSGLEGVKVDVDGPGGPFSGTTSGSPLPGLWIVENVPDGTYTVTPVLTGWCFCNFVVGGPCPTDPCATSIQIIVDTAHQQENQSLLFLATECVCGDGVCDPGEDTCNCADDCGTSCGDDCCNGSEDHASCAADCPCEVGGCDDGDACTSDSCDSLSGNCIHGPVDCSDGNPCTIDSCDSATGCANDPMDCSDGNACTDDVCIGGTCTNPPVVCDDGVFCNGTESCDPSTGGCVAISACPPVFSECGVTFCDEANDQCVVIPDDALCDDNNVCTMDACVEPRGGDDFVCVNVPIPPCDDDNSCTNDSCDPATGCVFDPIDCDDGDDCTEDFCEGGTCLNVEILPCGPSGNTVSNDKMGSLLIFSKVEIKWDAAGNVTQDTFLDIANDYPKDVFVQLYFVNGDEPAEPVFAGDPPVLIERGHSGWNWVDCQVMLTNDQPMYWSALTGGPLGCQMFTVLDPGTPPGRPDLDGAPGSRVLRGFVYAWAVDQFGEEICWNRLKGDAVIVNYADPSAWEYNAWAAETSEDCPMGAAPDDVEGHICLDGIEYDACYDKLLLDFYASGSTALSGGGATVQVDTDLTLFPVDADLRQDTCGPVLTKAKFDIWNMNEIRFSGTTRCITCWDQTLLSNYDPPNHFLLGNLHTDKGKSRIDGIASQVCDANDCTDCEWPKFPPCSQDAPLLGVVKKELAFSGGATGRAAAGMSLVGMGEESTCIWYDIIEPPDDLHAPGGDLVGPPSDVDKARKAPSVNPR